MYDINVLIHSVNNYIRKKNVFYKEEKKKYFFSIVVIFDVWYFHNTSLYLNAAFTRYDTATHQPTVKFWQNINFLKNEIYFFTFNPHFTFIVKILVNYRFFPWLFIKGFLKISFKKVYFHFIYSWDLHADLSRV